MPVPDDLVADLMKVLPLALVSVDVDGRVLEANPSAEALLGWAGSDARGSPISDQLDGGDSHLGFLDLCDELDRESRQRPAVAVSTLARELRFRRSGSDSVTLAATGIRLPDGPGRLFALERSRHDSPGSGGGGLLAHADALTGLPTRPALLETVRSALARLHRRDGLVGILFLDLDHMKAINDRLGHQAGDLFLCDIAARLRATVRAGDTVARLGGDEFVVAIPDAESVEQVQRIARRIRGVVEQPLVSRSERVQASVSIGIVVTGDGGRTPESLLQDADAAMYVSKRQRRGEPVLYDASLREAVQERVRIEADLRSAVAAEEIETYFQPIVSMAGGIRGAEALVRWRHPDQGLLPPDRFLPLAEETGLVHDLWLSVISSACHHMHAWRERSDGKPCYVSVNLSPRQFTRPDVIPALGEALDRASLSPTDLRLEVTETALIEDPLLAHRVLDDLATEGYGIALDDFGTGYSSLSHLQEYPVSMVKIDRSFTQRIVDHPRDAAIVRAVVDLGRALGLEVCAEGVETPAQATLLAEMECDIAQGYLWGRPEPAADFARRLEAS